MTSEEKTLDDNEIPKTTNSNPIHENNTMMDEESSEDTNGDNIIQPLKGQVSEVEKIVRAGD